MAHYCYLLECANGHYYAGYTTDPARREKQHNAGKGSHYTRLNRPVRLVYVEPQPDKSTALRREHAIKRMTHQQKRALVEAYHQAESS